MNIALRDLADNRQSIGIYYTNISDEEAIRLGIAIAASTKLRVVILYNTSFTDAAFATVIKSINQNSRVTSLTIDHMEFSPVQLNALVEFIGESRSLVSITVRFTNPESVFAICRAVERSREVLSSSVIPDFDTEETNNAAWRAIPRAYINRRLLVWMSALSLAPCASPLRRFLKKDGDNAISHRILGFLVKPITRPAAVLYVHSQFHTDAELY